MSLEIDAGPNFIPDAREKSAAGSRDISFNTGFRVGAGLNYDLTPENNKPLGFGVGIETGLMNNEVGKWDGYCRDPWLAQVPLLAKAFLYTDPSRPLQGRLGAGIGGVYSHVESSEFLRGDDDVSLAWEAEASVRYRFNGKISLGIVGKYIGVNAPSIGDTLYVYSPSLFRRVESEVDYIHNLSVGLLFNLEL